MIQSIKIASIRIGERVRKEIGPLDDLIESIKEVGLLHPIVISPAGFLVAGQRRVEAFKAMGLEEIPMVYAGKVEEAASLLKAERDENRCRKDMTPTEYVALGRRLEELEKPQAKKRKEEALARQSRTPEGKFGPGEPLPRSAGDRGQVTRQVAEAIGMSGAQYERARRIVDAAEAGDPDAIEAQKQMDKTGVISTSYDTFRKSTTEKLDNGPKRPHSGIKTIDSSITKQRGVLDRGTTGIEGIAFGLSQIQELHKGFTKEEISKWTKSLQITMKQLNQLKKKLTEYQA